MKNKLLLLALALLPLGQLVFGQSATCPSTYVPKPSQDCKGAITLCTRSYTYPTGVICGSGLVDDELGRGSCLRASERSTTWYVFKVRRSGVLKVLIYPLDLVNGDGNSGDTDYDFALIKLPFGLTNTDQVCSQINANSADTSWFRRCNFSGQRGITGISDTILTGGAGKIEEPIYVEVDDYYLLAVDNYSSAAGTNLTGYTVRFGDFDDPNNADIRPTIAPPAFDTVLANPTCQSPILKIRFNNFLVCNQIDTTTFKVQTLANQALRFKIDSVFPLTTCGESGARDWGIKLEKPLLIDSTYALTIQTSIEDICGSFTTIDTLRFRINPFIRLEPFVNDLAQDSVCSGSPIVLKAIVDEALNSKVRDYTYKFYLHDTAAGGLTELVSNDSMRIDSNLLTIKRSFPQVKRLFITVLATGENSGCQQYDTARIEINPIPTAPVINRIPVCFGDEIRMGAGTDADSVYYTYKWTSKLIGKANEVPQQVSFQVLADTVNFSSRKNERQKRGRNDDFGVVVTYKPQFGACIAPLQTSKLYVGKYMKPKFLMDSIIRPGLKDHYVLDTNTFYNQSVIRTLNNNRFVQEKWDFGDGTIREQKSQSDSVMYYYTKTGQITARLTLVDSLYPGAYCTNEYSQTFTVLKSVWNGKRITQIEGFVPNVVTPNGDGSNDVLEFVGLPTDKYGLKVYNRWGKVVYSASPYKNDWIPSGLESGTFYYQLKEVGAFKRELSDGEYRGWLEVVR